MYIINRVHSATAEGADEGAVFGESFCGSLGFGPFQKGGLLTPCFNDMVLITAAHAWIILGGMYRIVTVLRQPQFKNPKYFLNFWGFLFTLAIFVCSCVQLGEGVYFLAENKRSLAYIISFRVTQLLAWTVFFMVQLAEISRFLPHSKLVLTFSKVIFVPSTIKLYSMARDRYGLIQPEQKLTYYPMYAFICLLTLESIWYHYLAFGRQILTPENVEFDEIPENLELDLSGPRRYYENWSSSLTMAPKKIFAPSNAREIVQVVQLARKYKQTVRVIGNARTNNSSLLSDGFLVSLLNMDRLDRNVVRVEGEDEKYLVRVEAGKNLKVLFEELLTLTPPLCLPVTDDLWDFSLGGAVLSGRHGSGCTYPTMSQYVVGMELVTGTGEILVVDERNPDLLDAARVSLGYLGVVFAFTLKVEPSYQLEQSKRGGNVDDILANLPELLKNVDHFEFYWFPHTNKCQTVKRTCLKGRHFESKNPNCLSRFFSWYSENFVLLTLNRIIERFPSLTPTILKMETLFLDQGNVTGPTSLIQSNVDPLQHYYEVEFALPFDKGLQAFAELRSLIREAQKWECPYYCNQSISVRFSAADTAYLSPVFREKVSSEQNEVDTWKPAFMWIAFYCYDQHYASNATDFYLAVQDLFIKKYGGRPSWPGEMFLTPLERARCFPRFSAFARHCARLDPDAVFRNSFICDAIDAFTATDSRAVGVN